MKKQIIISLCLGLMALFTTPALAQNKTVTGTVLDEKGEPIIGASVMIAGEKGKGTVTDFDGNYTLEMPANGKVLISYIGYISQTVKPGGTVKLKEDSQSLEEVVVVGYGTQKKAHLTGSVASVPVDEIQDLANGSLSSTLGGLINGLSVDGGDGRPGEAALLYVRDSESIAGITGKKQQPLFVIDGYIYPNDVRVGTDSNRNLGAEAFNNLDPSEVESISVLKDASAAVYGARAADGVILVTTKKGKMGAPSISYSGTFGFTNATALPKMLSGYDYARLYNIQKAANPKNTSLDKLNDLYQQDELNSMLGYNYNLLDKYWKTAFTQKHSVNVSGATERVNYFAGIAYYTQDSNLGNADYNRWNYRAGIDVKISNWLSANMSVSGDYGKNNKVNANVGIDNDDYKTLLFRPQYVPEEVNGYAIANRGVSNGGSQKYQNYSYDILQNNGDYSKTMDSNTTINAGLKYDFGWSDILKGLTLSFTYAKSINTSKTNQYGSEYTVYSMRYRYGSGNHVYLPTGGEIYPEEQYVNNNFLAIPVYTADEGGSLARTMSRTDNYQMNFTVNYARDFGQHHVGALFSIEKSEMESEYSYIQMFKPYSFTNGQSNTVANDQTPEYGTNRSESGTLSYIGRLNYSYAGRYLAEFLLRSDASTKFAPQNYWGTFPSFSAGWVASEEPWFQNTKWLKFVDYLKIRASFGLTGRDNTDAWQWTRRYAIDKGKGAVFGTSGAEVNTGITINKENSATNVDIHWDKSYKFNFGVDFHTLNRRLAIAFDAYKVWNREMLIKITHREDLAGSSTVGTQSAALNFGKMNSWGYELGITWRDKIGKDFKYKVGLNTGYTDNEVLDADWEISAVQQYMLLSQGHRADMGTWGLQCLGMFRSYQDIDEYFEQYLKKDDGSYGSYLGMSKEQVKPGMLIYKDVRGKQKDDGTFEGPDHEVDRYQDMVQLSNRSNPYGFTLNLGAEWKGISLTTQLSANWGGYTTIPGTAITPTGSIEYSNMPSFWNPDDVFVYQNIVDAEGNVIQKINREATYPVPATGDFSINGYASSFWRVSAAKVTLNRLTIAYSIPKKWLAPIAFVKSARINITGQNLINFYNPYPDSFMSPMAGTFGTYPTLRKWTIGVNLSF